MKLKAWDLQLYLKRDSDKDVFVNFAKILRIFVFRDHFR